MAAQFTDAKGRQWILMITHGDAMRIKKSLGVSLYHLCDDKNKGLQDLLSDAEKMVNVVWQLCDQGDVSAEDFSDALDGATLEAMGEAFIESLVDFFPNRQLGKGLAKAAKKGKEVMELAMARMDQEIDKMTPEAILKAMSQSEATTSIEPSSSLPAKSA